MFCAGFFHTRKKFKNFSKEVIKSHLSFPIWCGKRDKHFSNHSGKGVRLMKPSDFQKTVWSYVNILDTKSQTFLCCTSS